MRALRKRRRHSHTVALVSCMLSAILLLAWPSAETPAQPSDDQSASRYLPSGRYRDADALVMPLSNGTEH
jgi:hypothetical protein